MIDKKKQFHMTSGEHGMTIKYGDAVVQGAKDGGWVLPGGRITRNLEEAKAMAKRIDILIEKNKGR